MTNDKSTMTNDKMKRRKGYPLIIVTSAARNGVITLPLCSAAPLLPAVRKSVSLFQQMAEGGLEGWKFELVSGSEETGRFDPRASQKHLIRHLSEGKARHRRRHGENRGAGENSAERLCEFPVRHGVRSHRVERPAELIVGKDEMNDSDRVVQRNPAPVLVASPDNPANTHFERRQHLCQGSSVRAQDHAAPEIHHANAFGASRLRGRLPLCAHFGQEPAAWRAVLTKGLASAVSVIADCRGGDHYLGAIRNLREPFRKEVRSLHAAVPDFRFPLSGPSPLPDVLARQVHDRVEAVQTRHVNEVGARIPMDLGGSRPGFPSDQANNLVLGSNQRGRQSGANQPCRSSHKYFHDSSCGSWAIFIVYGRHIV